MGNPLLDARHNKEPLPFDRVKVEHFMPALEKVIQEAKQGLAKVKEVEPSFENTVVGLLACRQPAFFVAQAYHNLRAAHGTPEMQELAKDLMPKIVELESDINLDPDLFRLVKDVYDRRENLELSAERMTLVEQLYRNFTRGGSLLDAKQKDVLRKIDEELSTLGPQFSQNVLKSVNDYQLVIEDEAELAGLPQSALDAAKQTAKEAGKPDAWVFTMQMPSYIPFLKYAESRERREELWRARGARAFSGDNNNQDLVKRIAKLRFDRANLLGYDNHAAYQTEERMAETPARVESFLKELLESSMPAAQRDLDETKALLKAETGIEDMQPWDYGYWSERLKKQKFDFDPEELRPYFKLDDALEGSFRCANKLYGLKFEQTTQVPVYHADVKVFEVTAEDSGKFMGYFYTDFFPRAEKSGGAWCTRYRSQHKEGELDHRPHVSIVCNFTKPTETKPSLLTFNEVRTLFHEFGHALHSLLSDCETQQLSCTAVYRDFVELPSQIMENWLTEPEGLRLFAKHYESGDVIPDDLVDKVKIVENFHAGVATVRQIRFGLLDMAWYAHDTSAVDDVAAYEAKSVSAAEVLPSIEGSNTSCSFEHIFAGGYSAGYYGYKWAEVLDADAFELFKEKGIFSREVSQSFCDNILSKGGSEHPMVLYKRFRGREPDSKALLRRCELI